MAFPRQEYWSGLPFLSLGDLPDPGIEPSSPALAGGFFTREPAGKPWNHSFNNIVPLDQSWVWVPADGFSAGSSDEEAAVEGLLTEMWVGQGGPRSLVRALKPNNRPARSGRVTECSLGAWNHRGEAVWWEPRCGGMNLPDPCCQREGIPCLLISLGAHIGHNPARSWSSGESGRYNAQRSVSWGQSQAEKGLEEGQGLLETSQHSGSKVNKISAFL